MWTSQLRSVRRLSPRPRLSWTHGCGGVSRRGPIWQVHSGQAFRGLSSSPVLEGKGRLGYGLGLGDEEFILAQKRLKALDPDKKLDHTVNMQLKALYRQATEGDTKAPQITVKFWGSFMEQSMNDIGHVLKGVSKEGARGEYIRLVTQIWERDEEPIARPYRRGTAGDGRTMFCERQQTLSDTGSDGHVIGSGSTDCGEKLLHEEIEDGVQTIWFNHPLRDNALTLDMLKDMPRLLSKGASDPDVFATVLTGEGQCYCGGLDARVLRDVLPVATETHEEWRTRVLPYRLAVEKYVESFLTHSKPLVAAVNGRAVGLGATTLALCDLVYATFMTTIHMPNQQLATNADGCASYTFPRIMGNAVGKDILLRGTRQMVDQAHHNGLITYVMDESESSGILDRVLYAMSFLPMRTLLESRHLMKSYDRAMLLAVNKGECDAMVERWCSREGQDAIKLYLSGKTIQLQETTRDRDLAKRAGSAFSVPGVFVSSDTDPGLPESRDKTEAALPRGDG